MTEKKKKIYSVLVENKSGVLSKVSGLFARRSFNIDSLAVGETDDPTVSVMTIVSSGDHRTLEQIEKQLNKKLDVIKVKTFTEPNSVSKELLLMKVRYNKSNRREILDTCDMMKAEIVDMSKSNMMIQLCAAPEKVALFIKLMASVSIVEMARTGTLALPKCVDQD
ncbi:MAG: acetolactate synthase small subunit [Lachnospiraceae bacterium]|nr:acetolactate synthase small subunit [Lachnospiraceae bacterium]